MILNKLTPILYTNNMQQTLEFYEHFFGFTCTTSNNDLSWAKIINKDIELMISKPVQSICFNEAIFTGSFYFNTDNVDEIWEAVKHKLKICYPVNNFEYGMREFGVFDNNGYLLQFGQVI
jgi:uncharacterized glyoxalase superfamily protein PhnB